MGDLIALTPLFLAAMAIPLVTVVLQRRRGRDVQVCASGERLAISDDPFGRLLDPAIDPPMAWKAPAVLADVAGVEKRNIHPDARLFGDSGVE